MGRSQVAAIDVPSQYVQEKMQHSGKKDEKCSESISVESGTDIKVKNEKMTQVYTYLILCLYCGRWKKR